MLKNSTSRLKCALLVAFSMIACHVYVAAQGPGQYLDTVEFASSTDWTIPTNVFSATLEAWGGGGAGGYARSNSAYLRATGGGGGGAVAVHDTYQHTASSSSAPGYPSTQYITDTSNLNSFNGGSGGTGSGSYTATLTGSASASAGSRGSAGKNYVDANIANGYDSSGSGFVLSNAAKVNAKKQYSATKSGKAGKVAINFIESYETKALSDQLLGIKASGTFARYFDVVDVEFDTVATSDTETRTSVVNGDDSVTVTYTDNGEMTAQYTYTLTENADSTTTVMVTNVEFFPQQVKKAASQGGVEGFDLSYQSGIKFRFVLSPKTGFLGGNDVPLLQYEEIGADDTGFRIGQGAEWLWLPKKDFSDFANVVIPEILDETTLDAQDVTITCGQSVNQATDMITVNANPLDAITDAWKKEFVTYVGPTTTTVSPTKTTQYSFTNKLMPLAAELLDEGGVLLCETDSAEPRPEPVEGLALRKTYIYGRAVVTLFDRINEKGADADEDSGISG